MRALDPALAAHLQTRVTTLCHCWVITRKDGAAFGFTDHDRTLTIDGVACRPETGATGSAMASSADLAVDDAEIEGALASEALSDDDLAAGLFDGAAFALSLVNWAAPEERVLIKAGRLGAIAREGAAFRAELRGPAAALDQPTGRLFQRACDADLGDARCGVDLGDPARQGAGLVVASLDETRLLASGLETFAPGWFSHGRLRWTGGANAGSSGFVKTHDAPAGADAALALWTPAGKPIAVGDAFEIFAGCDKRFSTCGEKFQNTENFRGFPLMPGNDFAISYPLRADKNDGGKRR